MIRENYSARWASLITLGLVMFVSACTPDSGGTGAEQSQGISIRVADITALESNPETQFQLLLSQASAETVTVEYALQDDTANAGDDYQPASGVVTFAAGETSKAIEVAILDDNDGEGSERFALVLSNPINASLEDASAYARINDDETLESVSAFDPHWGPTGVFTDAETCSSCHRASREGETPAVMRYPDALGEDVSPADQWRHSMMSRSFDDPYFQAKMQDEVEIFPAMSGFIEDKCLTCHAGMGRTHAHQTNTGLSQDDCPLGDGCYRYNQAVVDMHGREGVSCTLCHQIKADGLGEAATFSGAFEIAASGEPDAKTIYGPYQNPHTGGANAMLNQSGFKPEYGLHMNSSEHCASCHTLFTPTLDAETNQATGSKFLEQGPFLEWQNSVYFTGNAQERQCQDCHMADPEPGVFSTRIAVTPSGDINTNWPERSPFASHSMVGGNTYMLDVMKTYRSVLGIDGSTTEAGFDEKILQTRALLQQAASVDIDAINAVGDQLNIDVKVTNHTGHKLPSGFPSRRAWLHLRVKDAGGQTVFESGAPNSQGRLSVDAAHMQSACVARTKPEGFSNQGCYEPHRDVITTPDQVAIYESVMADTNDDITYVLLYADTYLKDNRLPPRGFTTAGAVDPQTLPVGVEADSDFNVANAQQGSGSDMVHYQLPTTGFIGPYSVEARLLYQTVRPTFVGSMHGDGSRVDRFRVMFEELPPSVEELASASRQY